MSKNIELQRMMVVSNEFYKLTKINERPVSQIDNLELIPIVTNCAFSIEVALKCLYYANNSCKAKTGYNIIKIYELTKVYGLEDFLSVYFLKGDINRILNELENAFEEFRYIYE